jgi:type I restriction enzyme S subunit
MNDTLPKGWIKASLKDVVVSRKGKKPKNLVSEKREGYFPYILIDEMEGKPIRKYTNDENVPIADKNDVLIVWDGSIGKTATNIKGAIGSTITALTAIVIPAKFLEYFLRTAKPFIEQTSRGTGLQHINPKTFWPLSFPLPPLNEQKRIVSKLDVIIPRIEAVKQRLEKVPNILKLFRQSVLTAAFTGKLTEKWREEHPEMRNTEVLSDKTIKLINKSKYIKEWGNFEVPYTWLCAYLGEIADLRLGKMLDGSKNKGEKIKYLRNVNVRWFKFDLSDLKEIKITKTEKEILSIKNGDIFICEGGEPGRAAVWKNGENSMTFQKALHRVRFRIPFESDFLVYNLKVDAYTQKLNRLFTGSTIKHLTGRSLALYPITFPPLEEQKEIVKQVEKLFAWADKVEAHYQKAKEQVDKLTQSVLAKAFRGELVPQDPNDEPAEKLLERILKEKAKMEMDLKAMKKKVRKKL